MKTKIEITPDMYAFNHFIKIMDCDKELAECRDLKSLLVRLKDKNYINSYVLLRSYALAVGYKLEEVTP